MRAHARIRTRARTHTHTHTHTPAIKTGFREPGGVGRASVRG